MSQSIVHVNLGARCNQSCTVCDCHDAPSRADAQGVPLAVRSGGGRLVLRGEASVDPAFARTLDAASQARWDEVWLRTNGQRFATPESAAALRAMGVRGVTVPLFSHAPPVHDRVAGRDGALVTALRAMRAADAAGMSVTVEAPLLPSRLQDLDALVRLAHRAVPSLAGARFYVPVRPQPAAIAPPPWSEARAALTRAAETCAALSVATAVHEFDAIPLCVLGHDEAHQRLYRLDPRRPVRRRDGFALGAICDGCAVKNHCLGSTDAYRAAHGERDLAPFATKPAKVFEQRTTPRREWRDDHREAASKVINRVLRPTVHCNQDCSFCSANETTENVFRDSAEMFRRIARLARSGVRYVSFSGGEPTLSKDLVHYIRAASRLGIEDVELVTNGALIDSPEKVRPLREAGLTKAFVSLHAHDELLSRRMTLKVGDWARTVKAIHALVEAGVRVDVNHVITGINYPYLPRFAAFVADTWRGAVGISFAFVTPQFRALERPELVPRLSDAMPYLRRAMRVLADRRSPFIVGSRQGVPPCFLGEFTAWSDFVQMSPQAHADDEPQKVRGPRCDACRFSPQCVGLWRPYAARHGFDELVPVQGPPLTPDEIAYFARAAPPVGFDEVHPALYLAPRDEPDVDPMVPPEHEALVRGPRRLPVVQGEAPLRIAMLGAGPQAVRLARALDEVPNTSLVGVASPHLLDRDATTFSHVVRERDAAALLDATRPDAVIVAAATVAHRELVALCVAREIPVLVEKPLARTLDEARALVDLGGRVMVAHAMAFSPGARALRAVLDDESFGRVLRASLVRRCPPTSPDAPAAWSRDGVFQTVYHAVYLLGVAGGGCAPTVRRVDARGDHRPETLRIELAYPRGVVGEISFDFTAAVDVTELSATGEHRRKVAWRREGSSEELVHDTPSGDRTTSVERGSDTAAMLTAFRAMARGAPSPVTAQDGHDAMQTALAVVDALASRIVRATAPKHVSSPSMR